MAESPSYYRAYGPVLRSLKDKSSEFTVFHALAILNDLIELIA